MLTLFKELNKNQASVWVYENKLKLTFTGGTPPDQLIDQVKQKKENILNFLNEKNIFSVEDFRHFISLENHAGVPATSSNNKKIEAIFPATSLQQGFVYHYLSQPQDDAYRVQLLLDYHSSINVDAYQQAWTLASRRFPILRTAFDWEGEILQIVTTGASIDATNFRHEDITELSEEEKNRAIDTLQQHDLTLPFDLRQPGLARFTLIKQRQQLITVVITLHHSIIDGWSYPILLQTVHGYYNALVQGHTPEIVVDNAYLNAQQYYRNHQADTDIYWSERKTQWQGANDLSALLSHRIDLTQIKMIEKPAEKRLTVQGNAYEQLKNTCRRHGVTLNVALQFAWHKLLHIYTADEQTIVGTTVSGRDIPVEGIESSVGLYINTLPLAVQWKQTDSVVTVLQHIQKNIADLNSHSAVSLASLQSGGERLFHSLLVFENYPAPLADENQTGIEQTLTFRRAVEKVDYPLSLIAYEQNNRLVIKFNYGKDWLEDEQALRLLRQLERILHEVACHPEQSHTAITCLSEEERHTLLHSWNQTDAPYPQDKTLPQLFEAQAAQHPDAIAVEFEEQVLSYGELNRRANHLAHYLITLGVGPDERVAICVERSPEMVVGLLAILKAGGAYVPLDPALPDERLAHMLKDSAPVALLTQSTFAQALEAALPSASHTVLLDKQPAYLTEQPAHNPAVPALAPHHLAYVIYTSGSTGLPKGVEMPQSALSNLLHWHRHTPENPTTAGKTLQFAALGFDVAFQEIFTTLCEGGCLVLINDSLRRDPQQLLKLVQQQQIERLFLPYVALQHFAEAVNLSEGDDLSCLKHIITAGEQLRITPAIQRLLRRARHCRLHNHYGPTESHVVTSYTLDDETEHWPTLPPIGRPIANTQIYILDPHGQPVPWGVTGEIYIAGKGVARGYLNRPELTAERFLSCPFSNEPGARMYKTGDLGRWLPDGNIDYLGRNDFQVKIRGFRIELGEIESALMAYSQIRQAVVIDREHQGHKVLAAYLVAEDAVSDDMLLAHLSDRLPDYMRPASFTFMEAIPLTSNGKVNRKALPEPLFGNRDSYVAPRNVLETQLCAIWQDVLALEQVGIEDNFFRIGGNSLSSIKLIAAIRRTLSTDISLAQLFELKTIAGLVTQMDTQIRTVIPPLAQARYPLSFAQERMLFIEQYEQGSDVYHIPYLVQLTQDTSLPVLETAINRLAKRHAVLRTVYRSDDQDQMYQQILDEDLVIPSQSCDDRERLLANVRSEIAIPFDLTTEPSLRLRHYQVADSHYLLLLWHHIAMDGWSIDIFMAELAEVYHALQAGRDSQLPELEITYGDYAAWQRDYLQGDIREQQLAYWQHTLAGYETLALPTDHPRPAQVNYQGRDVHFVLDASLSEQLRTLARTQETTLYTVLLSAFYVTVAKLTGQDDIVLGTPTDNRHHAQTLPLLGMFVNTLVLRAQLQYTDGVTALIAQVHKLVTDAKAHQDMPFEQLVEALNIERDTARHPLFQVMFSVQAFGENPSNGNLPFSPVALDETLYCPAKFDLSLFLSDSKTAITGCLNYAISLFNNASITRIADIYQRVLTAFVADQQQPLSNIDILSAQERHTLLHSWNQTDAPYPQDKTLPQLFEAQAAQHPDAIAVEFEEQVLSYGELNHRANHLAHYLITLGVGPDERVAICVERSPEMVVGLLAILKAGGAYVPLDPALPDERLAHMLKDSAPVALLTQSTFAQALEAALPSASHTVLLDKQPAHLTEQPAHNPTVPALAPHHLAYVIYTSGSTGLPKGVEMPQSALSNLLHWHHYTPEHPTTAGKTLQFAALGFDVAFQEIFTTLCEGGCLVLINDSLRRDPQQLLKLVQQQQIERLFLPYVALQHFAEAVNLSEGDDLSCLKHIITAGEQLRITPAIQHLLRRARHCRLHNHYGPTESHVVTSYTLDNETEHWPTLPPIGRPIANTQIYILDPHGQPVPWGVTGEIYIAGKSVARGYLNRPELTAERFLSCPFSNEPGTRMYKTGDLGRWLPDGNIDYLGRNDFQVKVRGFRIELGEIESALMAYSQIRQAVVIDREHQGHKVLVAYLVAEDAVSDDMLLTHLSDRLPDYMLPASFTFMDAIPLTPNGKVNRRALPEPLFGNRDSYVAPRNVLETQLCAIWQDVLALEQVGIDDNFFRIGGNSLSSIKLIAAIRRTLSTDISLAQLFELKTIAGLATQMNTQIRTVIPPLAQARYPLSFAQERMLFIEQYEQGSDVYHIPYLVQLTQDTSLPVLETAIKRLAERHAVLRTVYRSDDQGQMYQQILDEDLVIPSQSCDDRERLLANVRSEIAIPFDLTTEPSLRLRHYQVADNHYLLLLWHHIAMDGWSTDIFMAELAEIYHALQAGHGSPLPELEITYGDYAAWQRDYLQGDIREQQLAYWQHTLAGYETLALPTDHPRPAQVNYQGRDVHFVLDAPLSEQLRTLARTQETTLYTVLLSAFYITLAKLSGQDDIVIGTPTDNRHHAQTLPLLGMFVNSLALRAQLQYTDGVTALIAQVHKLVTGAKAHQDMPFEQLVEALNIERDTARHPLFQVMFSVQAFGENPSDSNLPFSPVALDETLDSPAKFDLSLFLSDSKTAITGCLNYALSLFNNASITRIADIYQRVLSAFVADPQQPLSNIDILSAQERHTLLTIWNQTDTPYPQDKTLPQLFEAQVAKTPDHVALVFEGESLTYHQLNQRANQLARVIRRRYQQQHHQTMPADTPIALYFDRSLEMIISILAVLKAGGAYVPVSPEYPTERVQFILVDTATPCVLTQQRYLTTLRPQVKSSILIAADNRADTVSQPVENLESINKSTDLAYIIYTSGTTGQPKGVMVEHVGVNNLSQFIARTHLLKSHTRALFFSNYVFDASVFEIFPTLITGASLFIVPTEMAHNSEQLLTFINTHDITKAFIPTALMKAFSAELLGSSLHIIHTGGEALNALIVRDGVTVFNQYGPTEITVCATQHQMQNGDKSIGKGIDNTRLYVLGHDGYPVPVGAPGELYIGGAGVARGYLNQPELTAERFVVNPFATPEDIRKGYTRLYKTGDLVRWLPNGELEYLGRNDFQVKIRGYRIELGEIENVLTAHPQVKQAVVIDREHHGHKVLAAYLVAEDAVSADMLLTHLSDCLPDYMLPASFTFIEAIPLTLNGKVDRKALPEPVFGDRESYVAPRNALETQLCAIWQAVLGLEQISIHDNFFRIGGDSIVSIQLVSKLRQAGFSLQVKTIFEAPTVAQLAPLLMQTVSTTEVIAEQGVLNGEFALLPVQQTFFDWKLAQPHHWNQAFMVQIPGNIQVAQIEQALIALAERHDILRSCFIATEQGYRQCYSADVSASLPQLKHADVRQCHQEELRQQLTQWQSGFDYHNGPLWQAAHLTGYADSSARLFFAFHHLIIDAVSWRIITEDMRLLLQNMALPAKTSSYRQWVVAVHHYAEQHQHEVPYWQQVLTGNNSTPVLDSLTRHQLGISAEMTDILLHEANIGYHTEINDLLLSALTVALQETFDQPVNHIILEGHGREAIDNTIDISETVGWFTTLYPVRLEQQTDMASTIIHTKEMLRAVPNKGIGYGALQQASYLSGDLPLISFNYLGQLGSANQQNWSITDDDCGTMIASENDSHLLLGINGAVQAGKLRFYIDSRLPQAKTALFIRAFEQTLNGVIIAAQKQAQMGGIKTASDYGIKGLSGKHLRQLQQQYQIEALYPATSLQQGFIYHHLAQPQDDAYRVQLLLDYHAPVDFTAYQHAWTLASLRFPILRTAFNWEEEILQIVTAGASIDATNFRHEDIIPLSAEEKNRAIDTLQQHDRTLPFDLRQPGLVRFTLIKQHQQLVTVLITLHHSIIDGWSTPVLLQTIHDYYNALTQGHAPKTVVDNAYLAAQQYYRDHQIDTDIYWSERKAQWLGANDLSALLSHRIDLTQIKAIKKPAEQLLTVQGNAYEQLKNTCRIHGVTLNVALQFAWHKLLHNYTGDEQTIVGTTVSGRDIPVEGIESSVGLYINTLPLAVQWGQPDSIAIILQNIQKDIADLNSHSAVSLSSLQSDGERLFQSLLVFENYPAPVANENQTGIEQTLTFRQAVEKVDYPLLLVAYEQGNRLIIKLSYGKDWLEDEQASCLLGQLERILHALACTPDQSHTAITCLSEAERHTLLHRWNQTDAPYQQNKTLPQLFETQVAQHPDSTAIVFEDQSISYGELNRRANRLAHHLIAQGVKPDNLVAICLERSLDMVVGILAILKAGGAYLPLDPAYPTERLAYMLDDATPVALLTQTAQADKLTTSVPTVWLDNPTQGFDTQPDTNPDVQALGLTSRHLAYVIYTSGSTGKPKGVMVEHRNILRLIINNGFADIGPDDCVAHSANPAFDAATWEIWSALLNGSCLHIVPHAVLLEPTGLYEELRKGKVTALWLTAGLFNEYLDTLQPVFGQLRYLLVGGDVLNPQKIKQVLSASQPPAHLLNGYGPTESTTFATTYAITAPVDVTQSIPIGRPIANTRIYLLDAHQQPVPMGASGEIYISGEGVARGYLNQPELTAERFLTDPYSSAPGAKMYKTGDMGRYLPDGNIEYLGRNDFQIKIRGFRIELGEIENALTAHPQVKQAVVIDHEHSDHKVLAAYLVIEDAVSDDMLLTYLSDRLPDYMLPASFIFMESIPLTLNGKVDRRALPKPVFGNKDNYVVPRNAQEIRLCAIWQDVLELERVGIEDNFFHIGGNSLLAIKLTSAIRHKMAIDIPFNILFSCKCIALLSQWLATDNKEISLFNFLTPESLATNKLFMIHPANGGSESYVSLANTLADNYNCIGIDNYNLSTDDQTDSLQRLAQIYMQLILTETSIDQPIRILGWSLGGQLAMEVAYQLEQIGAQNIQLFLLDTVINNAEMKILRNNIDISNMNLLLTDKLQEMGASETYINKVLETAPLEYKIAGCDLSGILKHTKITLFKAGEINPDYNHASQVKLAESIIKVNDSNISQWVTTPLEIILLKNHHHNSILECTSVIRKEIINSLEVTK
ncbi:amino acid adenylation domain-containing protein (plasmid) [Xenorhabdus stockiae]|uniref:non-ribosomal peptide synthetase n=1 Tax=Xenorhabdus stockiae TaxID=351614 RepID=UPI003CF944A4